MKQRLIVITVLFTAFFSAAAQEVISEIVVQGLRNIPEATVLTTMRTRVGQVYQQQQLVRDRQSLEAVGFFQDVRIYGQQLQDNRWRVVVEVIEWPVVTGIRVIGTTVFPEERIRKIVEEAGIRPGAVLNSALMEPAARAIIELYRSEGYFANVDRFEPAMDDPQILEVRVLETRVNRIELIGLTRTRPGVIHRLMDTEEGDLLNQHVWQDDLRRMFETQWFERIQPDSHSPAAGLVDVIIEFEEGRTGMFNVGLQLDPRNRLAGLITVQETNFLGTGRSVGVNLIQSAHGLGTSITLDYADPLLDERRTALTASVYSRETFVFGSGALIGGGGMTFEDRFSQRRTGAVVSLSRVLDRFSRAIIGLRADRVNTLGFLPDPGEEFVVQDGDIFMTSFAIARNRRDNIHDPSRGDFIRLAVDPSYANITRVGGQTTGFDILGGNFFTRLSVDYRLYMSPDPPRPPEDFDAPRRVIAGRLFAGRIEGKVPFTEQFFVGGSAGVRGYAEDRFWGREAILAQLEYRHPIQRAFNLVAFVDYGGAWAGYGSIREFTQSPSMRLHLGYGFGLNFRTALGPIRLDVGFDEAGRSRTHFLIGGAF